MKEEFQAWREVMKDKQGRYRTQSLFWETRTQIKKEYEEDYTPLFSIKNYDLVKEEIIEGKPVTVVYPSLKNIYLSYEHIPEYEYEFAMDVFGSWEHWQTLANVSIFRKDIKEWRLELDIKIKSEAIRAMMAASKGYDAKAVAAAKYLADKGYSQQRGRPSKEEVERQKKLAAGINEELASDMERLGLTVVSGSKS